MASAGALAALAAKARGAERLLCAEEEVRRERLWRDAGWQLSEIAAEYVGSSMRGRASVARDGRTLSAELAAHSARADSLSEALRRNGEELKAESERAARAQEAASSAAAELTATRHRADELQRLLRQREAETEAVRRAGSGADALRRCAALEAALDAAVTARREAEARLASAEDAARREVAKDLEDAALAAESLREEVTLLRASAADEQRRLVAAVSRAEAARELAEAALSRAEAEAAARRGVMTPSPRRHTASLPVDSAQFEATEAAHRDCIAEGERGRRQYLSLWLRAEIIVTDSRGAQWSAERTAVAAAEAAARRCVQEEKRLHWELLPALLPPATIPPVVLRRSRAAVAGVLRSKKAMSCVAALAANALRKHRARAAALSTRASKAASAAATRAAMQRRFATWRRWTGMGEAVAPRRRLSRVAGEQATARLNVALTEQRTRQSFSAFRSVECTELLLRQKLWAQQLWRVMQVLWTLYRRVGPAAPGRPRDERGPLWDQVSMLRELLALEEGKAAELERALSSVTQQRNALSGSVSALRKSGVETARLRLAQDEGDCRRRLVEDAGRELAHRMWVAAAPRRQGCDGWVLASMAHWRQGPPWRQIYAWLDRKRGQLLFSSGDPTQAAGSPAPAGRGVGTLRLSSVAAVEIELFLDSTSGPPPPVNRYQQLGFCVEMVDGAKHRFCAATVGERSEWLAALRRAVLAAWQQSTSSPAPALPSPPSSPQERWAVSPSPRAGRPRARDDAPRSSSYRRAREVMKKQQYAAAESPSARSRGGSVSGGGAGGGGRWQGKQIGTPRRVTVRSRADSYSDSVSTLCGDVAWTLEHRSYVGC